MLEGLKKLFAGTPPAPQKPAVPAFQASPIPVPPIPDSIVGKDREAAERLLSYPPVGWRRNSYYSHQGPGAYSITDFTTQNPNGAWVILKYSHSSFGISVGDTLGTMKGQNVGQESAAFVFNALESYQKALAEQREAWRLKHDHEYRAQVETAEAEKERHLIDRL